MSCVALAGRDDAFFGEPLKLGGLDQAAPDRSGEPKEQEGAHLFALPPAFLSGKNARLLKSQDPELGLLVLTRYAAISCEKWDG